MELISYAIDFISFFIQNTKHLENIKTIILFGSAARNQATKESDIDIFIDIYKNEKNIEKEIKTITQEFFNSTKYRNYWKLLNIKNEINIIVGKIDKWKLKDSMLGNSIILYQNYAPKLEQGTNKTLFSWGKIEQDSKRVMLNKKLFGFKHYKRQYKGLLEEYGGEKLGANVIIINTENLNLFLKVFHKFKVPVKILRIFKYE